MHSPSFSKLNTSNFTYLGRADSVSLSSSCKYSSVFCSSPVHFSQVVKPIACAPAPKKIDLKALQLPGKQKLSAPLLSEPYQGFNLGAILPEIQRAPVNNSGEYKPSNIKYQNFNKQTEFKTHQKILNQPANTVTPSWFIPLIQEIISSKPPTPTAPELRWKCQ